MKNLDEDNIGLYYRGFFIKNSNNAINLNNLGIKLKLLNLSLDKSFKVYSGIKVCNEPPSANIRKIKSEVDEEGKPYNFSYPLYFFDFIHQETQYYFCCLPEIGLVNYLFQNIDSCFCKFDLNIICSSFFNIINPPSLKLTRLNCKLNYDNSESVTSISLFGKNNLQSNIIRKFLQSYPDSAHIENPFDEKPPLLEPKSCRINFNDNVNCFSLNFDSAGNYSFYLQNNKQFDFFNQILKFAIDSNAFIYTALSPLKRTLLSLQKVE